MRIAFFIIGGLLAANVSFSSTAAPSLAVHIDSVSVMPEHSAFFARVGQNIKIELLRGSPGEIKWFLLVPEALDYNNASYCKHAKGCAQPIGYRIKELFSIRGKTRFSVSSVPELAALGTHEIMVRAEKVKKQFQLVIRQDDSYIGYATELLGVPFVYAPAYLPDGHQTELRKGADCVALILYARRRQGYRVPYSAPPKLYEFAEMIGDKNTISKIAIREGDILHFGFQTALIAKHRSTKLGLDDNDLIIHTYHGLAEMTTFSKLPYKDAFFDVLRWHE